MKRRIKYGLLSALLVGAAAILAKAYTDTNDFNVHIVNMHTEKLPKDAGFSILQISDLHNKVFDEDNESLIKAIKQADADLIVLTGDLIDRHTEELDDVFNLVEHIIAINPAVYYVSGNHEWDNAQTQEFFDGLRARNVEVLDNRNSQVDLGSVTLNLVGVDDASTGHEDMEQAFAGLDPDPYTILLSHAPGIVNKYEHIPADLILSGHTHGGQIRLPFIGALVAPDEGFFPKLDKGLFKIGLDQTLYIDSGLGTSTVPVRFMNKSQMSLIRITHK